MADKVTVLSANNDAVTIELDATTHLPLRRTFRARNETFGDFDEEAETYAALAAKGMTPRAIAKRVNREASVVASGVVTASTTR